MESTPKTTLTIVHPTERRVVSNKAVEEKFEAALLKWRSVVKEQAEAARKSQIITTEDLAIRVNVQ